MEFTDNCDVWNYVTVVDDVTMGRCLVSNEEYSVGHCIFQEDAYIFSTCDADDITCERKFVIDMEALGHGVTQDEVTNFIDDFETMKCVNCLDTARCFLQSLTLSLNNTTSSLRILYDQLTYSNLDNCIGTIKQIRKRHPKIIPDSVSNKNAAKMLGVLNNNMIELENLGGSGLFLRSCIMEHSCLPNCSFNTVGTRLFMVAISSISKGSRLSIDYTNLFYHPRHVRQQELKNVYNFTCNCHACQGPDYFRSFVCNSCVDGVCYVHYAGSDNNTLQLICNSCNSINSVTFPTNAIIKSDKKKKKKKKTVAVPTGENPSPSPSLAPIADRLISIESRFENDAVQCTTFEEWQELRSLKFLHETHYIMFWSLSQLCKDLLNEAEILVHTNQPSHDIKTQYKEALTVQLELTRILDSCPGVPEVHNEKMLCYDNLGQIAVGAEDIAQAHDAFERAFRMSEASCGVGSDMSIKLRNMVENTPNNITELRQRFS